MRILRIKVPIRKELGLCTSGRVVLRRRSSSGDSGSGKTTLSRVRKARPCIILTSMQYFRRMGSSIFARALSIRMVGESGARTAFRSKTYTGRRPNRRVGAVVLTKYNSGSKMELAAYAGEWDHRGDTAYYTMTINADFSLQVLKSALSRAIIFKGARGEASDLAIELFSFSNKELTTLN